MTPLPSSPTHVIIISGPAGSGKTTLCDRLLEEFGDSIRRVVTSTSRQPRPGEVDGVDYHFLGKEEFARRIRNGDFIEWALVHGRYYGSERAHILRMLEGGHDILLNIDVQGAETFRLKARSSPELEGKVHTIFIKPRSLEQIRERLLHRGSDDEAEIQRRLRSAEEEIKVADHFDHVILSGSREADYTALRAHYLDLKCHPADSSNNTQK